MLPSSIPRSTVATNTPACQQSEPILCVNALCKRFFVHERGQVLHAFDNVSFTALTGELTALVGPSGAGKSSVLKCIYRTYLASGGSVLYTSHQGDTVDLVGATDSKIVELRRNEIRFVSQFLRTIPRRSALQIVETSLMERGITGQELRLRAESALARVGLSTKLWHLPPHTFSGGEKQLVNMAQALAVEPRLLLLDEPTASLDLASTERILRVIETLKSQPVGIVGVFHNSAIIKRLADRTVLMPSEEEGKNLGQQND